VESEAVGQTDFAAKKRQPLYGFLALTIPQENHGKPKVEQSKTK
jgi:hypothetical protein